MKEKNNVSQANSKWTGPVPVDDTALAVTDTGGPGIPVVYLNGQFATVDDQLTGRENLLLIGDLRHVGNSAKTAAELLRRFGLEEAADRGVSTFSGGMR